MTRFAAEWVDAGGEPRRDELEAADRDAALAALPAGALPALRRLFPADEAAVAAVARDLAGELARARPLPEALAAVATRVEQPALKADLEQAASAAREGAPLERVLGAGRSALARHPLLARLVAKDPVAGLRTAAELLGRAEEVMSRAVAALLYPALLLALTPPVAMLVLSTAGARIVEVELARLSAHPGPFLQVAMAVSDASGAWLVASLLASAAALLLPWLMASAILRLGRGGLEQARVFLALAPLLRAGVPAPEARILAGGAAGGLAEGQGLGEALAREGAVSPAEAAVLRVAATAGPAALADELAGLAAVRLDRFERRAGTLAVRVGTLGLVIVGGAVALLASSIVARGWSPDPTGELRDHPIQGVWRRGRSGSTPTRGSWAWRSRPGRWSAAGWCGSCSTGAGAATSGCASSCSGGWSWRPSAVSRWPPRSAPWPRTWRGARREPGERGQRGCSRWRPWPG